MRVIYLLIIMCYITMSCADERKPKVSYAQDAAHQPIAQDTNAVEVSGLPIHFDSTPYLLHPIGEYRIYEKRSKLRYRSSPSYGSGGFNVATHTGNRVTGDLHNINFQHIDSAKLTLLTEENIRIQNILFLDEKTYDLKKQRLLYQLVDKDTNQDGKLDNKDIKTLYISNIDGSEFQKLTIEGRELIDFKIIRPQHRLYFRTIEDSNKNGNFDKTDKMYYHFVDLQPDELIVKEYNPI